MKMEKITRSSAVGVIAHTSACGVQDSYTLLAGLAVHGQHLVFICLQFQTEVSFWCRKSAVDTCHLFSLSLCFVAKRHVLQQKCL